MNSSAIRAIMYLSERVEKETIPEVIRFQASKYYQEHLRLVTANKLSRPHEYYFCFKLATLLGLSQNLDLSFINAMIWNAIRCNSNINIVSDTEIIDYEIVKKIAVELMNAKDSKKSSN